MVKINIYSMACFVATFLLILHHFIVSGGNLFDVEDMLHHEFLWGLSLGAGIGIEAENILTKAKALKNKFNRQ